MATIKALINGEYVDLPPYATAYYGGEFPDLNFSIVGSTEQPAAPTENMIWVNTDTVITDWIFSATQPATRSDGTPLSGGEVWFDISTSSATPINALKKNGLWVYPTACQQYVNGAWTTKTAQTYISGVWLEWWLHYFDNGNQFENVTGGWTADGYSISGRTMTGATAINSTLYTKVTDAYQGAAVGTVNPVNLTDLSTLYFNVIDCANDTGNHLVGVSKSKAIDDTVKFTVTSTGLFSIDVSALSGDYYIAVYVLTSSTAITRSLTIDRVYGE